MSHTHTIHVSIVSRLKNPSLTCLPSPTLFEVNLTSGINKGVFVGCGVGEWMISACVFPTVKHGGGGVMVRGCFAGDTLCDLFRIQGTLTQHGYHSILQRYAIPSGLGLVGL